MIGYLQRIGTMSDETRSARDNASQRAVSLGPGLPAIPERLLLDHARGKVLFLCGAGVSLPSGLPNFAEFVCGVYETLDSAVHDRLVCVSRDAHCRREPDCTDLTHRQAAELRRFVAEEYDVVLGMLERRLELRKREDSKVRATVVDLLRSPKRRNKSTKSGPTCGDVEQVADELPAEPQPSPVHRALMRLADRGPATTIVTTNFDLLLEAAAEGLGVAVETYSLGAIPRPSVRSEFSGVLHIHGALSLSPDRFSDLVLSDQDFGEFYLRRRVVPDFIYDAARLFSLVLVGYSANDPPMRYLLNAVAADEARFDDLKDRFIFIGSGEADPVELEGWRARGIEPIHYPAPCQDHSVLHDMLMRWAELSAINGKRQVVEREVRRIVRTDRESATEADRGLFDHLFRRSSPTDRERLAEFVSATGAESGWLEAMMTIGRERDQRRAR